MRLLKMAIIFALVLLWTLPVYAYRETLEDRISDLEWQMAAERDARWQVEQKEWQNKHLDLMNERFSDPDFGNLGLNK